MGRKSHKEVISLVRCSDSTFAEFEKFVVSWKKGEVPYVHGTDVHGVVGPVENEKGVKVDRDFSQLFVNRFRPVNGNRPRLQLTADGELEDVDNVQLNHPRSLDPAEHTIKKQDSNDQGSLFQAVQQRNVHECEEEGPLALALNYCRSLGSSHFDDLETVPLVQSQEPSVQPNVPIIPSQTLQLNENDPGLEGLILEPVEQGDDGISSSQQHDVQVPRNTSGPLALIQMSVCPAPDFTQMDNPLVKPSDLLLRKLLILDVEGLLLYAEGFMDRTSKSAAGDVIGAKKVIRRNGVQEFITRCFELFDIALWTCSDRNLLYDYTYYLFSGEQYGKFLFRWDQGKALDTNERWTRNHREIRLLLKPLKTVSKSFPDFNARNTLLVDVNPYRASANPEDTGIFPVPYTGSYTDQYLTTVLLPYLEGLSQAFDIREYVREHVLQGSQRPLHSVLPVGVFLDYFTNTLYMQLRHMFPLYLQKEGTLQILRSLS
ncbi:hypothetical protein R1sor_005007 [Riccia sorocarpa]|uniref:Mitochondrial import inner membrane translocase subunit TIM50 n=1 Tax=Riccia sorocarpa TaxID=122646 RepID=A0ABD3HKI4_9MARC